MIEAVDESIEIREDADTERFEILVGGVLAGTAEYQSRRGIIAFMHTSTLPDFGGRGLARRLIEHALDNSRERGLWVLPFCPFVLKVVAERPDYLALVPGDLRANFDLPVG